MHSLSRPPPALPWTRIAAFLGLFAVLYIAAAAIAEVRVGRAGQGAMQELLAARGRQVDWIVLGASHALPLAYGGVPERFEAEAGQSMMVLAEVGAGPLYADFVLRQALLDLEPKHILYVADSFAFRSPRWNEERIADRKLLRKTPWRSSTLGILAGMAGSEGVAPGALADYVTNFSKLNPPDRFPQDDWRGAENFDRSFRPSRHATGARIGYLYPEGAAKADPARYLDALEAMFARARAEDLSVTVVKLPVPDAFREALPGEAEFDAALAARLAPLGIPLHDLSAALADPRLYFDTDHLNRDGVELLYERHLGAILAAGG